MIAVIVDMESLLEVIVVSLVAGIGVSILFALAIYGGTRSTDVRRAGGSGAVASAYGFLGVLCFLGFLAVIAYGLLMMLS